MTTVESISAGALLVAIISLVATQARAVYVSNRAEKRITTKLSIFYALRQDDVEESELMSRLKSGAPASRFDDVEARKALYEMLAEKTVEYTDEGKWAAVQHVDDE